MRDPEIREVLREGFAKRAPDAMIVDELCIGDGAVRVDLAVVTEHKMVGYEIKSDFDTMARLANQQLYYSQIFDEAYVVCGPKYNKKVAQILPEWWGIYVIFPTAFGPRFREYRPAGTNPSVSGIERAKLLWRDEAIEELKRHNLYRGMSKASRRRMQKKLADNVSAKEIGEALYYHFQRRVDWR